MGKGKLAVTAIIGATAGAVAGIMAAPKSGRETRDDIKHKAAELKQKTDSVKIDAASKADDLKSRTEKVTRGVKKAYTEKRTRQ